MKRWSLDQITLTLLGAAVLLFSVALWRHTTAHVQAAPFPQTATKSSVSVSSPAPEPRVPVSASPTIDELKTAVDRLQVELIEREETYDRLQQVYDQCAQGKDPSEYSVGRSQPFYQLELQYNLDEKTERAMLNRTLSDLKSRLVDYMGASGYLQDKYDGCISGRKTAVCWGFWPRDTSKGLHWKAMPCEGED